ncbi:hypothetical protein OS493_002150 [Desmophyllum pertusum]|uniref:Uncharacterized protein n=1 Tax=Desmophyllum pertusum TaxID=174260 RepID=A0A9X0CVY5_9CNID|nr:hypothetical protein OS493_002150 [Desmophyllum pertusum]
MEETSLRLTPINVKFLTESGSALQSAMDRLPETLKRAERLSCCMEGWQFLYVGLMQSYRQHSDPWFTLVKVGGRKCIQFTDDQDGTKYALKVTNAGMNVTFEEQPCKSAIDDHFLFGEERFGKYYQYKHGTMSFGVPKDCDENLSLISTSNGDRRCFFKKDKK